MLQSQFIFILKTFTFASMFKLPQGEIIAWFKFPFSINSLSICYLERLLKRLLEVVKLFLLFLIGWELDVRHFVCIPPGNNQSEQIFLPGDNQKWIFMSVIGFTNWGKMKTRWDELYNPDGYFRSLVLSSRRDRVHIGLVKSNIVQSTVCLLKVTSLTENNITLK